MPVESHFSVRSGPGLLPCVQRFWTWREAVEVASRAADAQGRITLRREGDQWTVRYAVRLVAINSA